jgi:hypothetical protein
VEGGAEQINQGTQICGETKSSSPRNMASQALVLIAPSKISFNFSFWPNGALFHSALYLNRHFINQKLPELRLLNQNTFFSVTELTDAFTTDSAVHVIYGDGASINRVWVASQFILAN